MDFLTFLENLNSSSLIENQNLCDLETNLAIKKFSTLENAIEKMKTYPNYFLHWRNCNFRALKESRNFIEKPYFYPFHLEPYYSSWFIISKTFASSKNYLNVEGLIFVNQLKGDIIISLEPKDNCIDSCTEKNFKLEEEDSLVFLSEFWNLAYSTDEEEESLTTVLEINYKY